MPCNTEAGRAAFDAAIGAAVLDPRRAAPDGIVGPRGKGAVKRFNVYRNNVTHSLVSALAEIFPAVAAIVGEQNFQLLARDFLRANPPKSRLVFEYGDGFADFLAGLAPVRHLPYLPDLARLERAWLDAYHAADAAPLAAETVGALAPEALAAARFTAHPAAHLIGSRHAVHTIFMAHRGSQPGNADTKGAESVLVTRPHLQVRLYRLDPGPAAFIDALLREATLQGAAEEALEADPAFNLSGAIGLLIESGAATGLAPPDGRRDGEIVP